MSSSKFSRLGGIAPWKLRDYTHRRERRLIRETFKSECHQVIQQKALANPSYGYRPLHQELQREYQAGQIQVKPGQHQIRLSMKAHGLQPKTHKKRRSLAKVTPTTVWPQGRRIQMDATQLAYTDGSKVWVYDFIDVETRICLVSKAVTALSGYQAVQALKLAIQTMKDLGLPTHNLVIQTDGGSDFTSHEFQAYANSVGQWIRSKVSQVGGMGILERMHRTFKYDYAFKHEITNLQDLQTVCDGFKSWYNQQRLHAALDYQTPYTMLTKEAA